MLPSGSLARLVRGGLDAEVLQRSKKQDRDRDLQCGDFDELCVQSRIETVDRQRTAHTPRYDDAFKAINNPAPVPITVFATKDFNSATALSRSGLVALFSCDGGLGVFWLPIKESD